MSIAAAISESTICGIPHSFLDLCTRSDSSIPSRNAMPGELRQNDAPLAFEVLTTANRFGGACARVVVRGGFVATRADQKGCPDQTIGCNQDRVGVMPQLQHFNRARRPCSFFSASTS